MATSIKLQWMIALTVLVIALLASWGYFYTAQNKTQALLSAALANVATPTTQGGKPAVDPYLAGPVKNNLRKHADAMQVLWLAYLKKNPNKTDAFIEIDWQINGEGVVTEASVIHSEFEDKIFNEGITKIVKGIRFPPTPGGVSKYVAHKFLFKKD